MRAEGTCWGIGKMEAVGIEGINAMLKILDNLLSFTLEISILHI